MKTELIRIRLRWIRLRWSHIAGPAFILLAAVLAIAPQLVRGSPCGDDFDFHLVSWIDCLSAWQHGIPYPHWAPSANFGAGEPRFVFYPPLTWMLGAALGWVLPWTPVPIVLTFLLLAAAGLATRALARCLLPDGAATLAGCAVLFSGYELYNIYKRADFAELTGGFWIPLLLLYLLRDRHPSASLIRRALDGSALPLALVVAGCWLSNAPLGVMGCYLLAAVALAVALQARSWAPVLRAAVAAVLGIGLAALYLLPAAWEQRWIDVSQATDDPLFQIENRFIIPRHYLPQLASHGVAQLKTSFICITMVLVALAGLAVAWRRGRLLAGCGPAAWRKLRPCKTQPRLAPGGFSEPIAARWWIPLALIPLAVLFLQFSISLPLWNLLPKLRFLQFPWRWLVVLEAPMGIFFAAAVWPARRARRWAVLALCAVFFLVAVIIADKNFYRPCYEGDTVPEMMSTYRTGAGFEGADEYEPPEGDNTLIATGLPDACLTVDPRVTLGITPAPDANPYWQAGQGSCERSFRWQSTQPEHKSLRAVTPHDGFLILRLRSYPAWRIRVNGQPVGDLPKRDDDLMALPVPQGVVDLTVDWTNPPDALAGRAISVLAVLLLAILWLVERKLQKGGWPRLS
jgi:hypothetical protein